MKNIKTTLTSNFHQAPLVKIYPMKGKGILRENR